MHTKKHPNITPDTKALLVKQIFHNKSPLKRVLRTFRVPPSDDDFKPYGQSCKNAETIMHIKPDWHITDVNDSKIGWIGTDAAIRNQETFGNVEPHEILAPGRGDVVAKVFDRDIWVDNEKVAEIADW